MNLKMVFHTAGRILKIEALLLLLPLVVSLLYGESLPAVSFAATSVAAMIMGGAVSYFSRTQNRIIYAKEGFATVALAWLVMSLFGALPFVISREIPSYVDAFFETVSGLTTTGASVIPDVEALSHGMLFWRSFTHWIGGMGVLVFVMALIPNISDRSIHIMRAEMPGPIVGKLVPRLKDTAKILYLIYIVITLAESALLFAGGMNVYESLVHAFGTAGTGGFGIRGDSIAGYSAYIQWVITAFMLIFGVNFNLYYLMTIKRFKTALKSTELWCYAVLVVIVTTLIAVDIRGLYAGTGETIRHAAFQTASILTTTGYSSADFNLWPGFSKALLFLLMFIGGCAGSTAGGLKMSRVMLMIKAVKREFRRLLHPRSVSAIRLEGKEVEDRTVSGVCVYFVLYMVCILAVFLLLSLEKIEGFGFETHFTAAVSCFNNIGPGFEGVGPMASYAAYSPFSKLLLSAAMLLGRLEIYPLLLAFLPATWTKK